MKILRTACLTIALFLVVGRGLIAVFSDKTIGYLLQFLVILVFFAVLFVKSDRQRSVLAIAAMSVVCFASLILTSFVHEKLLPAFIYGGMFILSIGCLIVSQTSRMNLRPGELSFSLMIISIVLFLVAILQQYSVIPYGLLPGNTYVFGGLIRPASITGSYLHYPLIMSFFTFFCAQIYASHRCKPAIIGCAFSLAGLLMSFSRSGYFIVLIAACYMVFVHVLRKFTRKKLALLVLVVSLVVVYGVYDPYFYMRFLGIFNTSEFGNNQRIGDWLDALSIWMNSNLVVGEHMGYASNVATNLGLNPVKIPESSFLLYLLNLGLLGALSAYFLIVRTYWCLWREATFLKALCLGAVAQSLVYQSFEVLPFIFCFMLMPVVSRLSANRELGT